MIRGNLLRFFNLYSANASARHNLAFYLYIFCTFFLHLVSNLSAVGEVRREKKEKAAYVVLSKKYKR